MAREPGPVRHNTVGLEEEKQREAQFMDALRSLLVLVAAVIVTLAIAESGARFYDFVFPEPVHTSWKEYRQSRPGPYAAAEYDIKQIIDEAQVGWITDDDYGYRPKDSQGKYVNIKGGLRVTTNNPVSPRHRMYIFGGSTVMCMEVPDDKTVASYLSRIVNSKQEGEFEVVNMGATTITSHHQLYKLRHDVSLRAGDIVIFMDGVNDLYQTLHSNNPKGNMVRSNREQIEASGWRVKVLLQAYDSLGPYSKFVSRFLNPFKPTHVPIQYTTDQLLVLEKSYYLAIEEANQYVKQKGAVFFHFLQPTLYSTSSHTLNERRLMRNEYLMPLSSRNAFEQGYPRLKTVVKKASDAGIYYYDITDAFDGRISEIFLDPLHVNEIGNELLALAMAKKIPIRGRPPKSLEN